ncbi:LOW QUALITY PROTEIN: hatching enzyme 1.2-like [Amphibalanus amphitrite]|uniref:LOW QUALITY PROTEIN: hatching enzyme 1.2-like n=1 Tax=Amphibalanus amphitrite TaxID=1232801 RepID=UPI001C923734|nr:LOW QUALITY PROTEIN: hatching enzyme 1.2-like [Amphibalanus amphitrite]
MAVLALLGALLLLLAGARPRSVTQEDVDRLLRDLEDSYRTQLEKDRHNSPDFRNALTGELESPFDRLAEELEDADSEVSAGLYEGDIAGAPFQLSQFRVALNPDEFPTRRWDTGVVPYVISPKYKMKEKLFIEDAIRILNFMTCIKFVPWDGEAKDYLVIWPVKKPAGCWSFIGKLGGAQIVSLQPPDKRSKRCFVAIGKPVHEIIHALGFFHEQSRFDRDQHVFIIKKNIIPRFLNNFEKHAAVNTTIEYAYDHTSVMHYGAKFFSIDRRSPTMVPLRNNTIIGQRNGMSVLDCFKVNSYYGCLNRSPYERLKYSSICQLMGVRNNEASFNGF